jgi:hypothetical protein
MSSPVATPFTEEESEEGRNDIVVATTVGAAQVEESHVTFQDDRPVQLQTEARNFSSSVNSGVGNNVFSTLSKEKIEDGRNEEVGAAGDIVVAATAGDASVEESHVTLQDDLTEQQNSEDDNFSSSVNAGGESNAFLSFRSNPTELVTAKYFQDHYSLLVPSSTVRFRCNTREAFESHGCHVIENESHQIILEERLHIHHQKGGHAVPKRTIQIKRVRSTTKGLQLLRALYTVVCTLFVGLFLAFCVQIILNLVLDLAVISGDTTVDSRTQWWHAPPLLLALIQLCVTFSEGMVIATRFVMDAWTGHYLVKEFFPRLPMMRKNPVCVEWLFFVFLLGIPVTVMIGTLFAGLDNFWIITGCTWFGSVGVFFVTFAGYTVFYETRGAIQFVMSHSYPERRGSQLFRRDTFWQACMRCILMRQVRRYSGKKKATYFAKTIVNENEDSTEDNIRSGQDMILGQNETEILEGSYEERLSIWSRITMSAFLTDKLHLFHRLESPKKLFNIDDAQGLRPFVTKWVRIIEKLLASVIPL